MKVQSLVSSFSVVVCVGLMATALSGQGPAVGYRAKHHGVKPTGHGFKHGGDRGEGKRLFEEETFGGNGRTCLTCHSRKTGTTSPQDAQARFAANPNDPLFLHDGLDDGVVGVSRILADATVLITIPLPPNVSIIGSPDRFVTLRRGIPTTLNTPALDPVLMLDGRQPTLELQAGGAIHDHAQVGDPPSHPPTLAELELIKQFEQTENFFTSPALRFFALGGPAPRLPRGNTASEKRGRRFFEQVPPDPSDGFKPGLCRHCHGGAMMNQTNEFAPDFFGVPVTTGTRFQDVLVSLFNAANNPTVDLIFNAGQPNERIVLATPDPGRGLITGLVDGRPDLGDTTFEHTNAFKISPLRGIRHTAPYFHDNSAKTLLDVAKHYTRFFKFVTDGLGPGGDPLIVLTPQDELDLVAFMKLLD